MTVFTYSNARQNFASLLNLAGKNQEVLIKKKDGRVFSLKLSNPKRSPLDVKGVSTKISTDEIVDIVRESRSRK
jgi:LEA14-like dessication related protein